MFHRVKSEVPSSTTDQTAPSTPAPSQSAVDASETPDLQPIEAQPAPAAQTQEKDTTMQTPNEAADQSVETTNLQQEERRAPAAYAKAPQAKMRYGSSYPGMQYSAPRAEASTGQQQDRTLTIGAGITMSGEIESCDNLLVEGTVEAALKGARNLEISESGTFYGTVEIEDAVIAGHFEGDLAVTGQLTVRAGGVVTGTIAYGALEIETGAIIDGRLTPLAAIQQGLESSPVQQSKTISKKPTAKATAVDDAMEAANTDGGLFAAKA